MQNHTVEKGVFLSWAESQAYVSHWRPCSLPHFRWEEKDEG